MRARELTVEELREVYEWVDAVSYSKPKRNITKDFKDGCKKLR